MRASNRALSSSDIALLANLPQSLPDRGRNASALFLIHTDMRACRGAIHAVETSTKVTIRSLTAREIRRIVHSDSE